MHRVHFRTENVTIWVPDGANLRELCRENDLDPYPALGGLMSCRGKGLCGTCLVQTTEPDALSPPEKRERRVLKGKLAAVTEDPAGYRLCCQVRVTGPQTILTNPDLGQAWKTHGFYAGRARHAWESRDDA